MDFECLIHLLWDDLRFKNVAVASRFSLSLHLSKMWLEIEAMQFSVSRRRFVGAEELIIMKYCARTKNDLFLTDCVCRCRCHFKQQKKTPPATNKFDDNAKHVADISLWLRNGNSNFRDNFLMLFWLLDGQWWNLHIVLYSIRVWFASIGNSIEIEMEMGKC